MIRTQNECSLPYSTDNFLIHDSLYLSSRNNSDLNVLILLFIGLLPSNACSSLLRQLDDVELLPLVVVPDDGNAADALWFR
jgi:hypothetical protein